MLPNSERNIKHSYDFVSLLRTLCEEKQLFHTRSKWFHVKRLKSLTNDPRYSDIALNGDKENEKKLEDIFDNYVQKLKSKLTFSYNELKRFLENSDIKISADDDAEVLMVKYFNPNIYIAPKTEGNEFISQKQLIFPDIKQEYIKLILMEFIDEAKSEIHILKTPNEHRDNSNNVNNSNSAVLKYIEDNFRSVRLTPSYVAKVFKRDGLTFFDANKHIQRIRKKLTAAEKLLLYPNDKEIKAALILRNLPLYFDEIAHEFNIQERRARRILNEISEASSVPKPLPSKPIKPEGPTIVRKKRKYTRRVDTKNSDKPKTSTIKNKIRRPRKTKQNLDGMTKQNSSKDASISCPVCVQTVAHKTNFCPNCNHQFHARSTRKRTKLKRPTNATFFDNKKPVMKSKRLKRRRSSFKYFVAIDFGTYGTGVAYKEANSSPDDCTIIQDWPSSIIGSNKTHTDVLLEENSDGFSFIAFGHQAQEEYYYRQASENISNNLFLCTRFKMCLYEQSSGTPMIISQNGNSRVSALIVYEYALKYLSDLVIDKINKHILNKDRRITKNDCQWILTVPAIFYQYAKAFMRQASLGAGFGGNDNLLFAHEPEAAGLFCREKYHKKDLLRYAILDAGGGTVDYACHEIRNTSNGPELFETHPPSGGP